MTKKYIDAEKLKAEIERRMDKHYEGLPDADSPEDDWTHNELCELGAYKELEHIEDFLNSLQHKQPEIDLEKEIKEEYLKHRCYGGRDNMLVILNEPQFNKIAKRFIELGINTRKEE